MSRLFPFIALALLLAWPAHAQPYTLERRAARGERVKVTETRFSSIKLSWRGTQNAGGRDLTGGFTQRYVQEVRRAKPLLLHREYELSTATDRKGRELEERSSLHGRQVLVNGLTLQPLGKFKVSARDAKRLRFDRLAEALLPPRRVVALRESWTISSEALAAAIFEPSVAKANHRCSARVTFRKVTRKKGVQLAILKVRLELHQALTEASPEIDMALKGELKWAIEEGLLIEARLNGVLAYRFKNSKVGQESRTTGKGLLRWSYKAEALASRARASRKTRRAGTPPPPGTRKLVCTLNPAHQAHLAHMTRCMRCGEKLKRFTCKNECPWPFQYCPRDGAPYEPEARN